jgi:ATP-binding cassette subfamily F protein 3
MISLRNVTLRRGGQVLLEGTDLTIHRGQKVGIVGANGSGKSSFFALLLDALHADAGEVEMPAAQVIAHVAQETPGGEQPALDYVLAGDARLAALQHELDAAERSGDGAALARLHDSYAAIDGYRARSRAATILHGLGFDRAAQERPLATFSGGWRARLNLGRALMSPSDLLLLDEPTNHLDLDAVIWLEEWLRRYPGTLLLISHDRDFLDNVTGAIVHIEQRQVTLYSGNYAQFERQRAARLAQQAALAERQRREVAEIRAFVDRFRAKATKARQAQSRLKALARMELVAVAEVDSPVRFAFRPPAHCPNPLLVLEEVSTGYAGVPVFSGVSLGLDPGLRLGLLGRNGAGKSTLVKLLAGTLPPLAGLRQPARQLEIGYFAQHQVEALRADESPLAHLQRAAPGEREQALRDFLGGFGFRGDDVLRRVGSFSGGERTRLALALLVQRRPNLLLLDEPTNHLDMLTRDVLVEALQAFPGAVVVVSHDRYLLRACCDAFMLVAGGQVVPFAGDLDDYRDWLASAPDGAAAERDGPGVEQDGTESRREQRRREAEARQQRSRERRPLEKRLARLESDLERLHAELAEVNARLADESLYAPGCKAELTAELQRQGRLQQAFTAAERDWLAAGEALEAD